MEGQLCKRGNLMKWKWPINMKVIRSTHHQGMRGKAYWHVDTWQKPTQCCEAVILQLKINRLKSTTRDVPGDPVTKAVLPTSGIRGMGLKSHMLRGEAKKKKLIFVTWWSTTTMRTDAFHLQVTRWTRITNAVLCKTTQKQESTPQFYSQTQLFSGGTRLDSGDSLWEASRVGGKGGRCQGACDTLLLHLHDSYISVPICEHFLSCIHTLYVCVWHFNSKIKKILPILPCTFNILPQ